MVLSVRHRTTKEDIMSFDGKLLIVYAIKEGMVGKNSVANVSIGEVIIEGDFAKGQLVSGEKSPFYFHFYKEDANWKLDLTSIFDISNISFQKMAKDSEEKENDFLFNLLEMISGKKTDSEIWLPTIQK